MRKDFSSSSSLLLEAENKQNEHADENSRACEKIVENYVSSYITHAET